MAGMIFRGGYNVRLRGRPSGAVEVLPEPEVLHLPLLSSRFNFSEIAVEEGERVRPGHILAKDFGNHGVPLLAPRAGTVRLGAAEGHITLDEIAREPEEEYHPDEDSLHVPKAVGSAGMKRYKLLDLGAWQFLYDAHTKELPDPFGAPRAVIVSTLHLEPFVARGDVPLHKRLSHFTRGLEHIQALLEYEPIYLVLPDIRSEFARQVRETLRGYAWVKMIEIPLRYPFDNFAVLARGLGLKPEKGSPVWALGTEGVLAIDRALTLSRPCTVRIVSIGGPGAEKARHVKAMPGYPLAGLVSSHASADECRVISGGVFRGTEIGPDRLGLDAECSGLTLLPEHAEREFLGFMRPGWSRRSQSACFLSALHSGSPGPSSTAVWGEARPCVSCGSCEEVCPAGIMPHLVHKFLYQDEIEEADAAGVNLCVECGLCSYVCPSKLELLAQFIEAKEMIRAEQEAIAAEAAAAAAAAAAEAAEAAEEVAS